MSETFARSVRMSRFLRFSVEHVLNGRAGHLKEYVIGVEVFDRGTSYDPRVDPIVRVEARRLRSKLEHYYETEGREDDLIIDLPKGNYAAVFRSRGAAPPNAGPGTHSAAIAVLPLISFGPHGDDEYCADALTQELIHALTKVDGLRVVAWNSAVQMKGRQVDVYSIGQQLKVASVLRGHLRRAGERFRIVVQLVDTSTGYYLWSETFDRDFSEVFAIQEEISRAIVRNLKLSPSLIPAATRSTASTQAFDLYLRGRFYWNKRTHEGLMKSIECFQEAIRLDENFAQAYAGVADAFTLLADYGLV
ncbi:MAG: hypothetical protein ACRD7E_25140, partial [Bryobacteraceae bacterium]